jgi:hypothetical protein
MSQTDISKGSRWNPDIARNLDTAKAGIFCLTPSNLKSESILFEAGAISKSVNESRVYTLLAGVEIAELRWPLAQFQATSLNKDEIRKMLQDINMRSCTAWRASFTRRDSRRGVRPLVAETRRQIL